MRELSNTAAKRMQLKTVMEQASMTLNYDNKLTRCLHTGRSKCAGRKPPTYTEGWRKIKIEVRVLEENHPHLIKRTQER